MTRKIVSEMTYNVSMGTLNPTIPYHFPEAIETKKQANFKKIVIPPMFVTALIDLYIPV